MVTFMLANGVRRQEVFREETGSHQRGDRKLVQQDTQASSVVKSVVATELASRLANIRDVRATSRRFDHLWNVFGSDPRLP